MLNLIERIASFMLVKQNQPQPPDLTPAKLRTDHWSLAHPTLWSYLTQWSWEDGSPRQTCSLLMFVADFTLKAMLRDPNTGLCLWVTAETMHELYEALEAKLCDPRADWRVDRKSPGQQAKRVRKPS
jgi:K+-transporting ATPase A subunit